MRFEPMLAHSIDVKNIEQYINDDNYWFEQKLDGRRLLLKADNGTITAANRKGETITVEPTLTEALSHLEGEWVFDGEWIHGQFWIFDMPIAMDVIVPDTPYEDRRNALEAVFAQAFPDEPLFRLIDVSRTGTQKRSLLEWCREQDSEGIMVKARKGQYHPGKRTAAILKAKFWQTADCLIGDIRREGKMSSSIWLIHNGKPLDVGSIKMTDRDLDAAKIGDVVEVKYLYCTNDMRLYGPATFVKFRDDKDASECTTEQLRFVNKSIRELENKKG